MKVGIICYMDWNRSIVIENYYYAIKNLYGDVKLINQPSDANGLDMIFIGNDHFGHHVLVWNTNEFINICNNQNIKVIVIGGEKVYNTVWKHNVPQFEKIIKIKDIKYYMWDVEDHKLTNRKMLGYAVSSHYKNCVNTENKINKCIFIGQTLEKHYQDRRDALNKIGKYIDIDIISSKDYYKINVKENWKDYMQTIANYKFVFCPRSGTSNAIPFRFYEGLLTNTIPILQVHSDTLDHHPEEAAIKDCIFFEQVEELKDKLANFNYDRCTSNIWFEDKIKRVLTEDGIYVPQ